MKIFLVLTATLFSTLISHKGMTQTVTNELNVDGIKVIHKHIPKQVISVLVYVKGGTQNYTKQLEGVESLALNLAISGGTLTKPKTEFATATEQIGAHMAGNSGFDAGTMGMTCLKKYCDESWSLFSDALLNPAMDAREFELLKEKLIANARQEESSPDNALTRLAMSNTFAGTNYEKRPGGSPESLTAITLDDVKAHYAKVFNKANCFIVVVGDISEEDLKLKISKSLGKMPVGSETPKPYQRALTVVNSSTYVENRDIETNYIMGRMPAPPKGSRESIANVLAMSILNDRFFAELRTKRSLSYAPAAFASSSVQHPSNGLYITTTDPKTSMEVMVDEVNKAINNGFTEKELKDKKQMFLTYHYMGEETVEAQASAIGSAEIAGNWRNAQEFTNLVNQSSVSDVSKVFRKYANKISWTYLGKEDQVKPEMFLQPEMEMPVRD